MVGICERKFTEQRTGAIMTSVLALYALTFHEVRKKFLRRRNVPSSRAPADEGRLRTKRSSNETVPQLRDAEMARQAETT